MCICDVAWNYCYSILAYFVKYLLNNLWMYHIMTSLELYSSYFTFQKGVVSAENMAETISLVSAG